MMKKVKLLAFVLFISITIFSCTFPEIKKAKLEKELNEIVEDLKNIKDFEDAGFKWGVRTLGDKQSHYLQIQLINGEDLPKEEEILKSIGKEAFVKVFDSIENEEEYDDFKVIFTQKKSLGIASSTVNKEYIYTIEEILNEREQ